MCIKKQMIHFLIPIIFILSGCAIQQGTNTYEYERVDVQLYRAIDGDTISVIYNNEEVTVRFLLVDTPETKHPRLGKQPYGQEAKEYTQKMVEEAKSLQLEFDIGQNRDKYGRLLAYVYADDQMVQEDLLKDGLARVAYIYPPNTRYVDRFNELQKKAQLEGVGFWQIENYAQDDGFHPDQVASEKEEIQDKSGCLIKGNIGSEKIYHTPDSRWYNQTKAEVMFCTEKEAMEAGFRAPKK